MARIRSLLLSMVILIAFSGSARAEYRAYLLEVYDHIQQKMWTSQTGFDPQKYMTMHGGGNRLSVMIKATWMCWGETSRFKPACDMPQPKEPKFQVGEVVEITLDKHLTKGWKGVVELSLYRRDLKNNIYGVRFGDKKQMYGRYYEFNLKKVEAKDIPKGLMPQGPSPGWTQIGQAGTNQTAPTQAPQTGGAQATPAGGQTAQTEQNQTEEAPEAPAEE